MRRRSGTRWRRGLLLVVQIALLETLPSGEGVAQPLQENDFRKIAEQGFGDRHNTLPWSMVWWRGALYVGTGRASFCTTAASLDHWTRRLGAYPPKHPDVECTADARDLPLQAEIWRYRPDDEAWERVFQSPKDVELPGAPGKLVARDIGFRGMTVFTEPDGAEALYAGGVSARSLFGPELPPPRILRSADGVRFEPVPQEPGTFFGDLSAAGFRTLLAHHGRLYAIASLGLLGHGILVESETPAEGNDSFRVVSPPGMTLFEIASFQDLLYAGTGTQPLRESRPFSILKTRASGEPPYEFEEVVTEGAYRDGFSTSAVLSLQEFQGFLYAGTEKELLRIYPDDRWDLIVGEPRQTPAGTKVPLSGLDLGFDHLSNVHVWRMAVKDGWLYVGTHDQSTQFLGLAGIGKLLRPLAGFDLYATPNGHDFWVVSRGGFGDVYNSGLRNFASTPHGLVAAGANSFFGANVWLGASRRHDVPMPGGLEVEEDGRDALVSWASPSNTARFLIYRDAPLRPFREIASLSEAEARMGEGLYVFRDSRDFPRRPSHYYVVAEDVLGQRSAPSQIVRTPVLLPPATFPNLAAHLELSSASGRAVERLSKARRFASSGAYAAARQHLRMLARELAEKRDGSRSGQVRGEILIERLMRRLTLAERSLLPAQKLFEPS